MRPLRFIAALSLGLSLALPAQSVPTVGQPVPSFAVDDLNGTRRTEHDLRGHWTVAMVMTDKDVAEDIRGWFRLLRPAVPDADRLMSFIALNIFPLVPTATLRSQARDASPRQRWGTVWLSRDGSFARSLGLPEEEMPWVLVIDPEGRVALMLHERASPAGLARVLATLPPAPSPPAPPPPAR